MNTILGFIKDPHLGYGFKNRIRVDYNGDYDKKLEFIKKYSKDNQIKSIIATGDVFDNSYLQDWGHSHYIANTAKIEELTEDLDLYSIDGNHDQFSGSPEFTWIDKNGNIKRTVYGDIVKRGLIKHIDYRTPVELGNCIIFGISYMNNKEDVKEALNFISEYQTDLFKIAVMHQNCTPNSVKNITDFTYSELCKYEINCFVLGHYHIGYPTMELEGSLFINPWNLFRVARDYEVKMDNHIPEMVVLKVNDDKSYEFEHITIPHKSFEEAFVKDFREILSQKAKIEDGHSFIKIVDLDKMRIDLSDTEIIDKVYELNGTLNIKHKDIAQRLLLGEQYHEVLNQTVLEEDNE